MALTQEEKQIIEFGKAEGKTRGQVLAALGKFRQSNPIKESGIISRAISDIPEDVSSMVDNSISQFKQAGENIVDTATDKDLTFGEKARGIGAEAFRRGGRFIGGVLGTALKLPFTKEFEQRVADKAVEVGQEIAGTEIAQDLMQTYQNLDPDTKREVDNILGFAEGLSEIGTAGLASKVAKPVLNRALEVAKNGIRKTAKGLRGFSDVVGNVYDSTGKLIQPAKEITTGIVQQGKDFVARTARQARETAQESARFSELPAPEAKLLRSGADDRVVNIVKDSTPSEVKVYKELVEQAKKKEIDPTPNTAQPKEIAGREFLRPVGHLIKQRDDVGGKLGELRKALSTKKTINTNEYFSNFHRYLTEDLGLKIEKDGLIRPGVGKIATSDLNEIQKLYSELRSKTFASPKEIDEFLQRTFKEYDLRQAREMTFSDDVTRVAQRARSEMRKAMPDEYNALSTQYAEIIKPIQDMVKLLGYKGNIDELTAKQLKTAEVALRVLGNAADRPQSVISDVLEAATKYGYKSDVDLNKLIYITDQLEDLYDITPSRGFSGSTARGIDNSGIGAVADTAKLNLGGLFNRMMSSKATQEEVKEAFEAFLNSLAS